MSEQNNYPQNQNINSPAENPTKTENRPYAPVNRDLNNFGNTDTYAQSSYGGQYSGQYQSPQQHYTQQQYSQYPQYNTSQYNPAANSEEKTRRTCAIVGFVMAMVMILALIFGITMGFIFVIIAICLCVYGLKSSKKGIAIAGIVISAIEAMVCVLAIIGALIP